MSERKLTAETLIQLGWKNSWIDGVRRWHHDRLPAHFKTLPEAKALCLKYQERELAKAEEPTP